jgi:hypothetical protein
MEIFICVCHIVISEMEILKYGNKNIGGNLMRTENRIKFARTSALIGAVLDGIYVINIAVVWLFDSYSGFDPLRLMRFTGGLQSRYAWGIAFSTMAGVTCMLYWAARKPVERRDIIMLTGFPVVTGLLLDTFFAITVKLVPWTDVLLYQLVYITLIVLFTSSYFLTRPESMNNTSASVIDL